MQFVAFSQRPVNVAHGSPARIKSISDSSWPHLKTICEGAEQPFAVLEPPCVASRLRSVHTGTAKQP